MSLLPCYPECLGTDEPPELSIEDTVAFNSHANIDSNSSQAPNRRINLDSGERTKWIGHKKVFILSEDIDEWNGLSTACMYMLVVVTCLKTEYTSISRGHAFKLKTRSFRLDVARNHFCNRVVSPMEQFTRTCCK